MCTVRSPDAASQCCHLMLHCNAAIEIPCFTPLFSIYKQFHLGNRKPNTNYSTLQHPKTHCSPSTAYCSTLTAHCSTWRRTARGGTGRLDRWLEQRLAYPWGQPWILCDTSSTQFSYFPEYPLLLTLVAAHRESLPAARLSVRKHCGIVPCESPAHTAQSDAGERSPLKAFCSTRVPTCLTVLSFI